MSVRIAPSILSTDLGRLAEQVRQAEEGGAEWLHVDVMDGQFVPNLTFGAPLIAALRKISERPIDVHLMVERPERYIREYADLGVSVFTFHPEATHHVQRHLATIRERGMMAGLALNPGTPLSYLEEVVDDVDLVLVMSVNPGFGGQAYIPASTGKIRRVRQLLDLRRSTRGARGGWRHHDGDDPHGVGSGRGHLRRGDGGVREAGSGGGGAGVEGAVCADGHERGQPRMNQEREAAFG